MNSLDMQYKSLVNEILEKGVTKSGRNGNTKSIFSANIIHNMAEGFPLLTHRKLHFPSIVTELLWFMKGRTDLKWLLDNDCNIWTGDCYKQYKDKHHILLKDTAWTEKEFVEKVKTDDEFSKKWGAIVNMIFREL